MPEGSSLRFPAPSAGHPPTIEWMTSHLEALVGFLSLLIDTWQEPPPWVAPPLNASVCGTPIGMTFLAFSTSYTPGRCLQGKSDPDASRGLLLIVDAPKGTGEVIIM